MAAANRRDDRQRADATLYTGDRSSVSVRFSHQHECSGAARIAIVGGGPGGLFTAWHLERLVAAPLAITILEASDRLGGKVLTPSFAKAAIRYEAGAAELYDYSPVADDPLRQLVRSLGLPTVAMGGSAVHAAGRRIANLDDLADACGEEGREALRAFDTWARSAMTPTEFYESGSDQAASAAPAGRFDERLASIGSEPARHYVATMLKSDLATEPAATSTGYGLQNYLMNDPAYMRLYCIAGGNDQLIAVLASRLAADVRLGAAVTGIAGEPGGPLVVAWQAAGVPHEEPFDAVVVALPLDALGRVAFAGPHLGTAMRRHLEHHDHPAHYLRITVLFDRPLPAACGDDSYLMLDAFGGCCLYLESGREPLATHGVLGWLIGGEAAATMASWADEDLAAAAVATLPEPFAPLGDHVLEARIHRWQGAVSGVPGGWQPLSVDRRHRPAAGHPNLYVVGDYLYDATLNGVLDSAEHVAGWLAAERDGIAAMRETRGGCGAHSNGRR
jgi:monoamine oxidase